MTRNSYKVIPARALPTIPFEYLYNKLMSEKIMCVQAKEPLAIVDKPYRHFELNRVMWFHLVGSQYTGPMTKYGSETIICKSIVWPCVASPSS